jgi:NTE family protein
VSGYPITVRAAVAQRHYGLRMTDMNSRETRPKIGLALGGGAVRGFAHIGVLQVLEEANIPIDMVSGTSVGSVIGAFYCAGMPLNMVEEIAVNVNWWRLARPTLSRDGFVSFAPLEKWLDSQLGSLHFEDLAIPLISIATDLLTGETVFFDRGPLAPAIRASCSVPGLVTPVYYEEHILCDGAVSANVPGDVLYQKGADFVIGVDVFRSAYKRPLHLGPLGRGLTAVEIMVRASGNGLKNVDCLISPELSGATYIRFGKRQELIDLGRRATIPHLDCIEAQLNQSG